MSESAATPRRTAAVAFILAAVVLDVLALGLIIPVLPALVVEFLGGDTVRAATIYGVFGTTWALMQFICAPLLGALSDRFGRRPVLLLSITGLGLDYLLMALAPSLAWLFVGRVLSGITAASFSTAGAYIADITPPEKRASAFGLIGAAFGLGFVLGPALGGLLGAGDPRLPFWVAAVLCLLNAAYGVFVLPESLPPERRSPFSWARANPFGSLALLRSHPQLLGIAGVFALYHLAHQAFPSVFVLYTGHRFGWDASKVGLTLAGVGVAGILVQAGLVRPFVGRYGERASLLFGLFCGTLGMAVYGLAWTEPLFWLSVPLFAPIGLFGPAAQGMMSRLVGPSEQGQLQGANSSIMGLCGLVSPGLFTGTFAWAIGAGAGWGVPGLPFVVAAALLLAAMLLAARVTRA